MRNDGTQQTPNSTLSLFDAALKARDAGPLDSDGVDGDGEDAAA
jgi:hypothetical protein